MNFGGICKDILPPPSQWQECKQGGGTEGWALVQRGAQLPEQDVEKAAWT